MAGVVFFLIGTTASMIAEGRLIGYLWINLNPNDSLISNIEGFADGFALPMFFASVFFYLRGLAMRRSRKSVDHSDKLWHNSIHCSKETGADGNE